MTNKQFDALCDKIDEYLSIEDMSLANALNLIIKAGKEDSSKMLDHVHSDICPIEVFEFTFTIKDFLDHIGYFQSSITVNYDTKKLNLFFDGLSHSFDLNDGDVGEFWHGFHHKGTSMDLNFHVNDDLIASASVYGTITNEDGTISCDTCDDEFITPENVTEIGTMSNYITWINDEPEVKLTPTQVLEYAKENLEGNDIYSKIENDTLYLSVGDGYYELAESEIAFQAKEWQISLVENSEDDE